jgi:hypothetical protein
VIISQTKAMTKTNRLDKRLSEYTFDELCVAICEWCKDPDMNMSEYMCPNCYKDDEQICTECCGCYDEEGGQ